jgi:alkanesulfonate monooxygenase SsuD/methylene tetrahydromethanopterin reductase-like flavin-dependent oxidoreductase (luciferase family)
MVPSPSVFLAALAQRTTTLRIGTLVYTLAFHHPLKLFEEICMLDHLSGGRLEVGVGRGASPHELGYFGLDVDTASALYREILDVVLKAMATKTLDHAGKFFAFRDVPIEIEPLQRPHPPLWYGVSSPEAVAWPAAHGFNIVCNAEVDRVRAVTERYRAEWRGKGDMPLLGVSRPIVIAETDAEAHAIGRRAWRIYFDNFFHLFAKHGTRPLHARLPEDYDEMLERGIGIVGSPATVRDKVLRQIEASGVTYFIGRFAFGDLTFEESARSAQLFAREVMDPADLLALRRGGRSGGARAEP